jgi:succinate dehydrogenase/fumarate reductase flavoprotein subunit
MTDVLYDIIIVGAGSAGMPCAICAAARGKRVLVIEKSGEAGGTLHLTAGHLSAAGTKRQQEKNISDTTEQHYADIVRISRNTMDAVIAKKAVELAPATVDWLQELGYLFHELTPVIIHGHEPYSTARTYFGKDDYAAKDISGSGKMVLKTLLPLWNRFISEEKIAVRFHHSLKKLHRSGDAITSLDICDTTGNTNYNLPVAAAKLIITTGGYAASAGFYNEAMQPFADNPRYHFPKRLLSTARETSTGEGIKALMQIGAQFAGAEKHISTLGGIELEPGSGRAGFWDAWARVSNSYDRTPREIYVNENGQRFMNEQDLTVDERERKVLQQPGERFYVLFDEASLNAGSCVVVQWTAAQLKQEATREKCCWCANSIAVLAEKINVPVDDLQDTVARYNQFVAQQRDEDFGRSVLQYAVSEGPFYALLVYAYSLISFGGISVNADLNVLCEDGTVLRNVYAAGEVLGAAATSGNAFCGGMLLTPAISFGKWLGEHV